MISRFTALLEIWLKIETACSVAILAGLTALISVQVFLRYAFNNPLTWAEELAALALIYLSFLTGDIVYKKRAHISIDYVVGFFPPRLRAITDVVLGILICIFLATLTLVSLPLIQDQFGFTIAAALPLPKSYWTMPVPVIFTSMFLTTLNDILQRVAELKG